MKQYLDIMKAILDNGFERKDRTGTGTIGIFGQMLVHDMKDGFPLLTTKKLHLKSIIHELLWFLNGDTNIKYLNDNGVTIWDEWADEDGNLGPVYGHQWRNWSTSVFNKSATPNGAGYFRIDQIAVALQQLKTNPNSRRNIVSAWNVSDLDEMRIPPCHYGFQLNTRELSEEERIELIRPYGFDALILSARTKFMDENNIPKYALSLLWNQRSCDYLLGIPFNTASYALLLMMFAQASNMIHDKLIGSFGDTHLYKNHLEQAKLQLSREPRKLPTMLLTPGHTDMDNLKYEDFQLIDYNPYPSIKADISV